MVRADEANPLQARPVGQPKLRAQRLKALHGWLTYGSMMSGKSCRSPATKKAAVDYTAAQRVAAALLASTMGNTSRRAAAIVEQRKISALLKMLRPGLTYYLNWRSV
jgi:hypothetical protein